MKEENTIIHFESNKKTQLSFNKSKKTMALSFNKRKSKK